MNRADFRWETATGLLLTIDQITDDHLQHIERHMIGRGELKNTRMVGDDWDDSYAIIRDELERRGLPLLPEVYIAQRPIDGEAIAELAQLDMETYGQTGKHGWKFVEGWLPRA